MSQIRSPLVQIQGLTYQRQGQKLFSKLDLQLNDGDHAVIVGASGCGKSSLLHLIAAGSPSIKVAGERGIVLQDGALLDSLDVRSNLTLVARAHGLSDSESLIHNTLTQLGVSPSLYDQYPTQLSGGQMRRVAVARALLCTPTLLMLDEPDAGLDLTNLERLASSIKAVSAPDNGLATLSVSHNPFYIARAATKVFCLSQGQLKLVFDWTQTSDSVESREAQISEFLLDSLEVGEHQESVAVGRFDDLKTKLFQSTLAQLLLQFFEIMRALASRPRFTLDSLRVFAYVYFLAFISGAFFFAAVGLMLGGTLLAVIHLISEQALQGIVTWFVKGQDILTLMKGSYAFYLAPPIAAMLYAARSGGIIASWIGELTKSQRILALDYLGVSTNHYLRLPSLLAGYFAALSTIALFTLSVWVGGVISGEVLFGLSNAQDLMPLTAQDANASEYYGKLFAYSGVVALVPVAMGWTSKRTSHEVNMHTTKSIIYSTLTVALIELLLVLS